MHAQHFGNVGRKDQHQENERHQRFTDDLLTVVNITELAHEGPHEPEHEQHIQDHAQQRIACAGNAARLCDRNDRGQQAPCGNIVVRRAGDRQHAHRRFAQVALLNDAREHRKGRNADRDADKKRERYEGSMPEPEFGIDLPGQYRPEEKRHDDARMADDERLAPFFAQDTQVELHTDDKHKKDQADLAQNVERFERIGRKEESERFREKVAQQRRAEHDARDDLADHARLAEVLEQPRKNPHGDQDRNDLQQQHGYRMVHPFVQRLREEFKRRGTGGGCLLHRNMARNHLHGFPVRFIKSPIP